MVCCKCNKTGSCKGCACVKAGNKCFNCLPGKIGHCSNATIVLTTSHEVAAANIARQSPANISTTNVSLCTTLATSSQSNTCSPSSSSQSSQSQPIDECRQSPAPPNDATPEATLSAPPDSVSPPVSDNSLQASAQVASSSPPLPTLQPLNFLWGPLTGQLEQSMTLSIPSMKR